jgi:hypothetical protein
MVAKGLVFPAKIALSPVLGGDLDAKLSEKALAPALEKVPGG